MTIALATFFDMLISEMSEELRLSLRPNQGPKIHYICLAHYNNRDKAIKYTVLDNLGNMKSRIYVAIYSVLPFIICCTSAIAEESD